MRALFVLSLRQMLGGKKIWILAVFLSLPILLLALILSQGGFDIPEHAEDFALTVFLYVMYPQALCIFAALLYGASLLAAEIEEKTLTYLFTRALPRWKVLLGKYLATATALSLMTVASMSVAHLLCGLPNGARTWMALAAAVTGACFAFTAVFCLLGLYVPRRAIPVGLIYAVVVEGVLSTVPAVVNELTVSYYLRSVSWHIAQVPLPEGADEDFQEVVLPLVAGAELSSALTALTLIAVVTLSISAIVIHRRQWPLTEDV